MKGTTILIILGIAATIAAGFFLLGKEKQVEKETQWKGEAPLSYGNAADPAQGLYEVRYDLVSNRNAILPQVATFYAPKPPTLKETTAVVRIPYAYTRRHYRICEDCPYSVRMIRPPVPTPLPEEPAKDEKE